MLRNQTCPNNWKAYSVQEIFVPLPNLSYSRDQLTHKAQILEYIHYGDIHTGCIDELISEDSRLPYLVKEQAVKNIDKYLLCPGDIVLVDASEDYDGVTKSIEISNVGVKKIVAGLHTIPLRPLKGVFAPGFARYVFKHSIVSKTLKAIAQGTKVFSISFALVKKVILFCPPIAEQQKIVEVLETWDKAIQLTRKLIEQKELQKKGLLQQLVYKQPKTVSYFLRQLFTLGRGRVISKEEIAQHPGAYPVYSSQTADNGVLGFINTFDFDGEYITWTTDGANAGKVFYRTGKFNCTNVCGTAQLKQKNQHNLYYIMSYLNNVTKKYVSYVGNPKLMNGVFANILIALPSKELQDKATALLTTLDKEIDLLRQKLAKLEEQKKGLMQVLLTGKVRLAVKETK